jgi:hypothetical protein
LTSPWNLGKELKGVTVKDKFVLCSTAAETSEKTAANAPLLCGLEVVRE